MQAFVFERTGSWFQVFTNQNIWAIDQDGCTNRAPYLFFKSIRLWNVDKVNNQSCRQIHVDKKAFHI